MILPQSIEEVLQRADIVEIIETEKGPIYVANMWYKEWKRIPQLIHSELVEEFIPVSNESFDMNKSNCDRCGKSTNGTTIMSIFNDDIICMPCKEKEKQDMNPGRNTHHLRCSLFRPQSHHRHSLP